MEGGGEWEVRAHRVALWGRVRDASGIPVPGVQVELTGGPKNFRPRPHVRQGGGENRQDTACSRRDGLYYFLDLPPGEYTVEVSGVRKGERAQTRAKVGRNKDGSIRVAVADLEIPPG